MVFHPVPPPLFLQFIGRNTIIVITIVAIIIGGRNEKSSSTRVYICIYHEGNIMPVIASSSSFPPLSSPLQTFPTLPGSGSPHDPRLPVHASLLFTQLEPLINMPFGKWRPWSKEPFISIRQAFVGPLATRVLGSLGYQPDAALPITPACTTYSSISSNP